jgi:hypothetical protein
MARPILAPVARMLNRHEGRLIIGCKDRAAEFCADRNPIEQLRGSARLPFRVDRPETIRAAGRLIAIAIRRNPETSCSVDGSAFSRMSFRISLLRFWSSSNRP